MNTPHAFVRSGRGQRFAALFSLCLSFLFVTASALAAGGSITGRVINATTGKVLQDATVTVVGTTASAQTGADGTYTIDNVPPGVVSVKASYPGIADEVASVTVPQSGPVQSDFNLNSGVITLDNFVVNGVFEGQAAAIARQEKSLIVKNVVATEAWGNVSNGDMGTFLQRLPGVVGEYGGSAVDMILVRGMAANFTTISVDGSRLAVSNSSSTRTQVVSALPADAIESVEVIKTPTADMDADSLGGVVNMKTRSGYDRTGRTISLNGSANYNETFGKHADPAHGKYILPRFSADYSEIFSVFGGKNNLAVSFTAAHEDVAQVLASFRLRFQGNWDYIAGHSILRYPVEEITNEYFTNKRDDANVRFDYKFSKDNKIAFGYGYNHSTNHLDAVRPDWTASLTVDPSSTATLGVVTLDRIAAQRDIRDTGNTSHRFFVRGEHKLPGDFKLDWQADHSSSYVSQDRISAKPYTTVSTPYTIDRSADFAFPKITFTTAATPDKETFSSITRMNLDGAENYRNYEYVNTADINLKKEFATTIPVNLKTGFRIREDHRNYNRDDFNYTSFSGTQDYSKYADHSFNYPYMAGRYVAPTMIDVYGIYRDLGFVYQPQGGIGGRKELKYALNTGSTTTDYQTPANIESTVQNSLINDYRTTETIPAGYVQSEIKLTSQLATTLGLRYEQTRTEVTTRVTDLSKPTTEEKYGGWKELDGKYNNVYPNVQFRYEPMKRLVLRAAFSETIGRPELSNYTSSFQVDSTNQKLSFGNASIGPQHSKNFDLSAEYYFEPSGFVSVGVFEKQISDFIAGLSFQVKGNEFGLDLSQYVGWTGSTNANIGKGTVKGLEFSFAQRFTNLPGLLSGFGVAANGTWMQSTGDYGSTAIANATPPFNKTLPGFRPRTGNAGIFYMAGRFDVRLMLNYQSSYLSGLNTGDYSQSVFIGARHQFDMNLRFKLTSTTSLFFDVVNLTSQNRSRYWGQVSAERRYYTDMFPRQLNLGVQVRL